MHPYNEYIHASDSEVANFTNRGSALAFVKRINKLGWTPLGVKSGAFGIVTVYYMDS